MGFYSRVIFPRILDWAMRGDPINEQREHVLAGARGDVLEIGFGTGLNLRYYPENVRKLTTVDPNPGVGKLAARRIAQSPVQVEHHQLSGERLPMADASFDTVVSTWTMCSIADLPAALAEIRRVLRPDGRLRFIEHGLSPDAGVARWQHRLNPFQKVVGEGCHFNRDFRTILSGNGFRFEHLDNFYLRKTPKVLGYLYRGAAARA